MEQKPEVKTVIRKRTKWNETTGKYAGEEKSVVITNVHELSIDDVPPAGVDGPLSRIRPVKNPGSHASYSAQAMEDREE
jgi:hypothetical protein